MELSNKKVVQTKDVYFTISWLWRFLQLFGLVPCNLAERENVKPRITVCNRISIFLNLACHFFTIFELMMSQDVFALYGSPLLGYSWMICLVLNVFSIVVCTIFQIFKMNDNLAFLSLLDNFDKNVSRWKKNLNHKILLNWFFQAIFIENDINFTHQKKFIFRYVVALLNFHFISIFLISAFGYFCLPKIFSPKINFIYCYYFTQVMLITLPLILSCLALSCRFKILNNNLRYDLILAFNSNFTRKLVTDSASWNNQEWTI